ncbi:hypothetical protein JKP88DRAFT_184656 [Tribonema minus]|uniref:Uncharacterized protein n=1 Tax=Tribonema minus TaxID=303371 RepID=A0A835Z9M4_9STRA|nr:hypothetical protein JKP88DRAFT_184656 [Tribonema minus]
MPWHCRRKKRGGALLLVLLATLSAQATEDETYTGPCSLDLYQAWYNKAYEGPLQNTPNFWIFSSAELSNGQAMEKAATKCKLKLEQLRLDRAGRHGPVEEWWIFDVMCSDECVQSDALRRAAMAACGCDCLALSTQAGAPSYRAAGDWCAHNSGRLLCATFYQCGTWACRVGDFMCPRFEYNQYRVAFRGPGNCSGAAALLVRGAAAAAAAVATAALTLAL